MRVYARIAVAGEVFGTRHYPIVLQGVHISYAHPRYPHLVLPEGACINYRVGGIVVHIHIRGKIYMHTQPFALRSNGAAHTVHDGSIARSAQHHLSWKVFNTIQPHAQPPFAIHSYQQRCLRHMLVAVGQHSLPACAALHKYEAAHLVRRYKFGNSIFIIILTARVCRDHE